MMRIDVFGPTVVEWRGRHFREGQLGGAMPRQILEMLALDLGTPIPKEEIAERLWEGQPPASYQATLESYVYVLRRRLAIPSGRGAPLATSNRCYVLDPEQVSVGVVEVRALLASDDPVDVAVAAERASSPLLASEPYAAWAVAARDEFGAALGSACTRAAIAAGERAATERSGEAERLWLSLARTAVARDRWSEVATGELMRALCASGERAQALQAYSDLRSVMAADLGVEPGLELRRHYVSILRESPPSSSDGDLTEVRLLVRLLCAALQGDRLPLDDPELRMLGRLLVGRTEPILTRAGGRGPHRRGRAGSPGSPVRGETEAEVARAGVR